LASQTNKKRKQELSLDVNTPKFLVIYEANFSSPSDSTAVVDQKEQQITETSVTWEYLDLTKHTERVIHLC